jgi:hypothetical protein
MLVYQRVSGISNRIASGVLKHGREVPFDKEGLFIWENHLTKWDFPLPWSKKNQRVTSIIYCQARKNGLTFPMDELSQLGELTSYVGKTTCSQMKKNSESLMKKYLTPDSPSPCRNQLRSRSSPCISPWWM